MRLSSLFEEFCSYLSVERGCSSRTVVTYRKYFSYFLTFATTDVPGNAVLREHFTPELCRRYQYSMAQRGLEAASIRVRLAVLASFGKWSARRGKLSINQPVGYDDATEKEVQAAHGAAVDGGRDDPRPMLEAPGRGGRGPTGLRRPAAIRGRRARRGGLRRGLWPAQSEGQGGYEAAVALPEVARTILDEYLERERPAARFDEPLFLVRYKKWAGSGRCAAWTAIESGSSSRTWGGVPASPSLTRMPSAMRAQHD